uniref:Uncharacterized protein n=1 Tax=Octopus bimaculoides TaxID=37653 RepID=A0A0L8IEC2_OCTBM
MDILMCINECVCVICTMVRVCLHAGVFVFNSCETMCIKLGPCIPIESPSS